MYLTKNDKGHQRKSYFYLEALWTRIFGEIPVDEITTSRLEALLKGTAGTVELVAIAPRSNLLG